MQCSTQWSPGWWLYVTLIREQRSTTLDRRKGGTDIFPLAIPTITICPVSHLFVIKFCHPVPSLFRLVRYKCTTWPIVREDAVSACFDSTGQQLYVMHRMLPPCLYELWDEEARLSFMDNTGSYKNTVTMKSGCFMGQNDEVWEWDNIEMWKMMM